MQVFKMFFYSHWYHCVLSSGELKECITLCYLQKNIARLRVQIYRWYANFFKTLLSAGFLKTRCLRGYDGLVWLCTSPALVVVRIQNWDFSVSIKASRHRREQVFCAIYRPDHCQSIERNAQHWPESSRGPASSFLHTPPDSWRKRCCLIPLSQPTLSQVQFQECH